MKNIHPELYKEISDFFTTLIDEDKKYTAATLKTNQVNAWSSLKAKPFQ